MKLTTVARARIAALTLMILLLGVQTASAVNLIVNGDFENGNTGFSSQYTYDPSPPIGGSDYYAIGNNPYPWNGWNMWASFGDHTSGTGLMLIADGHRTPNMFVWQQTVNVASFTPYAFSFWGASSYSTSPAVLRVYINNVQLGELALPFQTGQWVQFSTVWDSGSATQATIKLVDANTAGAGNDFVLDDISMQAVPEPATLWLFASGIVPVWLRLRKRS